MAGRLSVLVTIEFCVLFERPNGKHQIHLYAEMPFGRDEKSGKVGRTFPDFQILRAKESRYLLGKVIFTAKMRRNGKGIVSNVKSMT